MDGLKRLILASLLIGLSVLAACGVKGPPEYPSGPWDASHQYPDDPGEAD